jgi:hypothetical protein
MEKTSSKKHREQELEILTLKERVRFADQRSQDFEHKSKALDEDMHRMLRNQEKE